MQNDDSDSHRAYANGNTEHRFCIKLQPRKREHCRRWVRLCSHGVFLCGALAEKIATAIESLSIACPTCGEFDPDRAVLSTPPSVRGSPRITRQNGASVTPRQWRYVPPSGQPVLGRVPCRPTPTYVPCSWHHPVRDLRSQSVAGH
jgi:hypothetical protein